MRVVVPIKLTDTTLTSSTIPEPDVGEIVWSPYTSVIGDRRINTVTHRVYESVIDGTTDDPVVGVTKTPKSWVNVKPTNKYAMFDGVNSTQSTETTQLIVETTLGVVANSIAGFSIDETNTINVTVTDPIDGIVYNTNVDMNDNSQIVDFYEWHFNPIIRRREFALLDLPAYGSATIKLTADGNNIKFGNFIVGNKIKLGVSNFGTNLNLLDFSITETDDFGNTVVTPRRNAKLVEFDVAIETSRVSFVFNTLASLLTIPAVWVGTESVTDATLVFGYYTKSQINISNPSISFSTFKIQGLT